MIASIMRHIVRPFSFTHPTPQGEGLDVEQDSALSRDTFKEISHNIHTVMSRTRCLGQGGIPACWFYGQLRDECVVEQSMK